METMAATPPGMGAAIRNEGRQARMATNDPSRRSRTKSSSKIRPSPKSRGKKRAWNGCAAGRDPITLFTALLVIVGGVQWCTLHDTDTSIRGQLGVECCVNWTSWSTNKPLMSPSTTSRNLPSFNLSTERTGRTLWNVHYTNFGKARRYRLDLGLVYAIRNGHSTPPRTNGDQDSEVTSRLVKTNYTTAASDPTPARKR